MSCKAYLHLDSKNNDIIMKSIEGLENGNEKFNISIINNKKYMEVEASARDSISLRAGLNSFMSIYNLSDKISRGMKNER